MIKRFMWSSQLLCFYRLYLFFYWYYLFYGSRHLTRPGRWQIASVSLEQSALRYGSVCVRSLPTHGHVHRQNDISDGLNILNEIKHMDNCDMNNN